MAGLAPANMNRLVETIKQSGPVDVSRPLDVSGLKGKTILITGGASGIGASLARGWAAHGASMIIGDINSSAGEALVAELRRSASDGQFHHFQHCNVLDWQSQVELFKAAAKASPSGGIDAVVPNAGIVDPNNPITGKPGFENPVGLDGDRPPPPDLRVLDINSTAVFQTVHLALFWLARNNPGRDRHILLIGSIASFCPVVGESQYTASKHAVMGLFRSLRATSWRQGVRVNILCPYFIDSGLMSRGALALLAGGRMAKMADVVDAATRLMADDQIVGRGLAVGPRIKVRDGEDGEPVVELGEPEDGQRAIWDPYAHDFETVESFTRKYTRILNTIEYLRGWAGWVSDLAYIFLLRSGPEKLQPTKRS
ncbi:uncharacterized protein PpBr36_09457 [Pyricularia pennisetigena]|uniref:uncharacterized protein n=1 Tax=Pyricularia pennisetigena TaxID=1578925 RepID=UPI00114E95AA|nr:uncharacterized protein PpBr36_09457 [Pyricularia pennisetigena]TLS21889.1 hypothetical protein PpBr36_09457 [Pyricularia pennisetigena]